VLYLIVIQKVFQNCKIKKTNTDMIKIKLQRRHQSLIANEEDHVVPLFSLQLCGLAIASWTISGTWPRNDDDVIARLMKKVGFLQCTSSGKW